MLAKTTVAGLMMGLMVLSAPLVWADAGNDADSSHQQGDWHHGHQDHQDHVMAKALNLSEDQVKQLKDSREKDMTAMKSIFEQMKSNREAFDAEIAKATPDMTKISAIQTQIKTIQSQMVDNHLNSLLEVKKILNPEQFAGYMALQKAGKMMHHVHKGGFNRDGDHKHWADKSGKDSKDVNDSKA